MTLLQQPHQWAQLISALCIEKALSAENVSIDVIKEVAEEVIAQLQEQMEKDFDDKVLLMQEQVHTLARERDKLINSCWYRTTAKKIHWKQGRYFGTSLADYTETAAYLEALDAIRHNAGLKPVEELN